MLFSKTRKRIADRILKSISKKTEKDLPEYESNQLMVDDKGNASISKVRFKILRWYCFPVIAFVPEETSKVKWGELVKDLVGDVKSCFLDAAKEDLTEVVRKKSSVCSAGQKAKLAKTIMAGIQSTTGTAIDKAKSKLDPEREMRTIIARCIYDCVNNYTQEILAQVREQADTKVVKPSVNTLIGPVRASYPYLDGINQRQMNNTIWPNNTIFAEEFDGSYIVVMEQPPQVRAMSINHDVLISHCNGATNFISKRVSGGRLRLALPYVIHILKVTTEGQFQGLYVFYSNKPIKSLDDDLLTPSLSNIHDKSCMMCLGDTQIWHNSKIPGETIADWVRCVIDAFWLQKYTSDLDQYQKASWDLDRRVSSFDKWHESSIKNPNFMIEISWPKIKTSVATGRFDNVQFKKHTGYCK